MARKTARSLRPSRGLVGSGISTVCKLCGDDIRPGEALAKHRSDWIHRGCAPGGDDG